MPTVTPRRLTALFGLAVAFGLTSAGCESGDPAKAAANGKTAAAEDAPCPHCVAAAAPATKPVAAKKAAADDECEDCAKPVTAPSTKPTTAPGTQPALTSATQPAAAGTQPAAGPWRDLFDGKSIKESWKVAEFAGHGEVEVKDGVILMPAGETLTGVTYTGKDLPKMNYEVEVVARRVDGVDFFCGLTFPVNDTYASLICGGWGGTVVGISSLNDEDAAHNETTKYKSFKMKQWYTVRLRVTPDKLQAWIDDAEMVDVETKGKKISVRGDIDEGKPFGVAAFATAAEVKSIRVRTIGAGGK